MRVLSFVNYVWYRIFSFYKLYKERIPISTGIDLLSLVITSNILTIVFIYQFTSIGRVTGQYVIMVSILVLIVMYSYFTKKRCAIIISEYENELPAQRRKRGILTTFYVIGSVLLFITTAIYIGIQNHKL